MQIPGLVQGREGAGQQGGDFEGARCRHRPAPQPILERAAGQELHDEKRAAPPRLDAVDLRDRRMRDRRHGPRFRLRSHQAEDGHARQGLDGDVPLEPDVARQVGGTHSAASQAPRQSILAGQELRSFRLDIRRPAVAFRRLAGRRHVSAHGALLGRRRVRRAGSPRARHEHAPDRQPRRRPQRLEKREVDLPHDPAVEAPARHQDARQLRAGTRERHDGVGARCDDPPSVLMGQQVEVRRFVLRLDAKPSTGGLQHAHDGGRTRQGRRLAVRILEVLGFRRGIGPDQQGDGGAAAAPGRPAHDSADRRHAPHLGQCRRRIGQGLPLVGGLGVEPRVEAKQQPPAARGHQQQENAGRGQRPHHRIRGDGAHRLFGSARQPPA